MAGLTAHCLSSIPTSGARASIGPAVHQSQQHRSLAPSAAPRRLDAIQKARALAISPVTAKDRRPGAAIGVAISGINAKHEQQLAAQGITSVDDLERVHFDLHLGDMGRTRQFLQDVVGIRSKAAVKAIVDFLGSTESSPSRSVSASPGAGPEIAVFEPLVMSILSSYSGLSLDRLFNLLYANTAEPRFDRSRAELSSLLSTLVAEGKVTVDGDVYRYKSRTPGARRGSPSPARSPSPTRNGAAASLNGTGRRTGEDTQADLLELAQFEGQVLDILQNYASLTVDRLEKLLIMSGKEPRYNQGSGRLTMLLNAMAAHGTIIKEGDAFRYKSRTPTPERKPSPTASRGYTPPPRGGSAGASSAPAAALGSGRAAAPTPSRGGQARSSSVSDLSAYEDRIMELLQRYASLPLERINNMLRMSSAYPPYEAGSEQLRPFLTELVGRGKLVEDNGSYRLPSRSPSASATSRPLTAGSLRPPSPSPARGGSPRASGGGIYEYEPVLLDLLQNYSGLSAERLNSLLANSPKAAGYKGTVAQLSGLLSTLVSEGKVTADGGVYRFRSKTPGPARSPSPTRGGRASPRAGSPSPSRASGSAPPASIAAIEQAALDLLQSYAGLTADRLNKLLQSSPKAPGYNLSVRQLEDLLSSLQNKGRVTVEAGVYKYRSTGKTPQGKRAGSPTPPAGGATSARSSTGSPSVAARPAASSLPPSPTPPPEWAPYDNTLMTTLGNYGALPAERVYEIMRASMVWPRFEKSLSELKAYMDSCVAAGRLVQEGGLYRRPGMGATPKAPSAAVAKYEDQVLKTLASYSGLSLDRLHNMLRLSNATPTWVKIEYTASPDELAQLLAWLESKGRVVLDNEVYKVATGGASKSPAPAAATVSSGPYELENNAAVLSALGFPTAEGTFGFTPFVEVLHGRLAMAGIVGSVARELNTDMGTLEQLGVEGLPSIELLMYTGIGVAAALVIGAITTTLRNSSGAMPDREQERYRRFLAGEEQELVDSHLYYTDELKFIRKAELTNGRAAMIGFLATLILEMLTGRGVVGQAILWLKFAGLLDVGSGY